VYALLYCIRILKYCGTKKLLILFPIIFLNRFVVRESPEYRALMETKDENVNKEGMSQVCVCGVCVMCVCVVCVVCAVRVCKKNNLKKYVYKKLTKKQKHRRGST
jgi:hypothetical protein